jgi:hypothetical protein
MLRMRGQANARSDGSQAPRHLAVAILTLGFGLPLLAPNRPSASGFIVRRDAGAGSLSPNHARHDRVPRRVTAAARGRLGARPTGDGGSVAVLLLLTLNSGVMLARMAISPPSWTTD